jgi:hypothetical protein
MKMNTTGIAVTLAALVLRAVPAAGAGSPCETKVQTSASRVKAAAGPFTLALLAAGQNPLTSDGLRALLYAKAYEDCAAGLAVNAAVPGGGVAGSAVCVNSMSVASAGDPEAAALIRVAGSPVDGMVLALGRSASFLRSFLTRPVPEPMRRSASDLLGAVEEGANILRGCAAEFSKPLVAIVMPVGPTPPPALTSFDGYLGGNFAIHLDNGKATVGSAEAALDGGVTISPKNDPSLKLSVNGRVVLKASAGSSSGPGGSSKVMFILGAAGQRISTWASLEGQGSVRASLWGWNASLGESHGLRAGSDGILYFGSTSFDFFGCRYASDEQSRFESSVLTLHGRLSCGSSVLNESTARIGPSGYSGNGRLALFGHTFDTTYDLSTARLKAHGRYEGPTVGWNRVPGFDAEYRVSRPTVDLTLDGPTVSATFDAEKVEVQTVARNKNNQPWAQASLDPDPVTVGVDGSLPLRLAHLPSVSDAERGAREACVQVADRTTAGRAHDAAVALCNSDHPSPPSIPDLPTSISVSVGVVVK